MLVFGTERCLALGLGDWDGEGPVLLENSHGGGSKGLESAVVIGRPSTAKLDGGRLTWNEESRLNQDVSEGEDNTGFTEDVATSRWSIIIAHIEYNIRAKSG